MRDEALSWRSPPRDLTLGDDVIHVWRATLDQSPQSIDAFAETLSSDERARAARFRFPVDRDRFVVGRGVLRALLGRYLGLKPAELRFSYGAQGKPELLGDDENDIRFNLSHSRAWAVYAFTRKREIGIDLEFMRDDLEMERLAERFFAPSEAAQLRTLSPPLRRDAFFRCWSRKEAFIKARGEGLSLPLDGFEVSLLPGAPAALRGVRGDAAAARCWMLRDIVVAEGFAAALAVDGAGWSLALFDFPAREARG